jgi:adenosylmethionine-8-amino-7-oxononanoate aminotransferase
MILRNNGDILVLAPPLVVTREIIDEIADNIESGIVAAIERFGLA